MSNRGRMTAAERYADAVVLAARQAMADLLGADPGGIVFGRSMTQLTFDLSRALAKTWQPGDEVVVTRLDHDANIRPWLIAAESAGAVVRWAEFDPATGELPVENVAEVISPTDPPGGGDRCVEPDRHPALDWPRSLALAHDVGALFYVDGVHFTAHAPVDVDAIGADLYACSPYKFLGPHCGVVAGRVSLLEQLRPDKLLPSTDLVPERFELGTLPYELLAGTTAAVDFLADLAPPAPTRREQLVAAMSLVEEHEDRLRVRHRGRAGRAARRGGAVPRHRAHADPVADLREPRSGGGLRFLAERDINVPAGSFYAIEASRFLGLGDAGGLRVGLAPYSSRSDVDRLLDALTEFTQDEHRPEPDRHRVRSATATHGRRLRARH